MSGRDYDFDGWMVFSEKPGKSHAVHFSGHLNISEDQIYLGSAVQKSQRLACVRGLKDIESMITQEVSDIETNENFVFNNKNSFDHQAETCLISSSKRSRRLLVRYRKVTEAILRLSNSLKVKWRISANPCGNWPVKTNR